MLKSLQWSVVRTRATIPIGDARFGFTLKSFKSNSRPKLALSMLNAYGSRADEPRNPSPSRPPCAVAPDLQIGMLGKFPFNEKISEEQIMKFIYSCRFFTILGVLGSLAGSFLCFIKGSVYVARSYMEYFVHQAKVISILMEAIDTYLIATVMLVFGMGLYELFICNLDVAEISSNRSSLFGLFTLQERPRWLEIKSVDELKTKVGHVIVLFLLVGLLEKSMSFIMTSPLDILYFAASILVSSCGLYLLSRLKS